ncbi:MULTISPECIES: class I SAM-dependent methyltransferase [unclassified Streptomyces]|uniref:class I SAM-dependent methyltransferase n=1 Tax=unclassified Streptomyces TaxID=2593676 RepID=UPI004041C114
MTEQKYTLRNVTLENLNLEAVYEGYREDTPDALPTPWDIGRAQSALVALEDAGQIKGEVIDVGCGLGDNAIFLASRGYRVTGVDGSANAIDECRKRARVQGVDIEFAVADAATLDGFEDRFDTVVDSALYHCLNEENQRKYVAALHRATKPGARLHLFCFAKELPSAFPVLQRISEQNLRETVGKLWDITSIKPALYDTSLTPEILSGLTGKAPADGLELNEQGQILSQVWQLTAERID